MSVGNARARGRAGRRRQAVADRSRVFCRCRCRCLVTLAVPALLAGCSGDLETAAAPQGSSTVEAVAAQDVRLRTKARIARDGTVLMSVQLSLPVALTRLNLSLPELAGDQFGFNPRIRGLRIFVDGQSSQLVAGTLRTGSVTTVALRQPASVLELRYKERGAVVRTKGSSAGRALAWLTSLSISPTGERSSTVSISGSHVLNLGCAAPGDPLTSCGHHTAAGGWRIGALPRDAEVYAQVNLPAG